MICGNYAVYRKYKSSGKYIYRKLFILPHGTEVIINEKDNSIIISDSLRKGYLIKPTDKIELCDGEIGVDIYSTSDGCNCCGTSSVEIDYQCRKCAATSFRQTLPRDTHSLAGWIEEAIKKL